MAAKNNLKTVPLVFFVLVGLLACSDGFDSAKFEGTWRCFSSWTWDNDGVSVPVSYTQRATCKRAQISSTAVLSIGDARWSETYKGTCYTSGRELCGERTSLTLVATNDAARQFERDKLDGRPLVSTIARLQDEVRLRITSVSETEFSGVNDEGRTVRCQRVGPAEPDQRTR